MPDGRQVPVQEVWLWQSLVCPLWAGFVARLADRVPKVRLIVPQIMSPHRKALGWSVPSVGRAEVSVAPTAEAMREAAASAAPDVVHICQGVRGNGLISAAQVILRQRNARQFVTFETIDDAGLRGGIKRLVYRRLFDRVMPMTDGILAIGELTPDWLLDAGVPAGKIFPFAYFISEADSAPVQPRARRDRYRFLFVGQFVDRKRLDLLIQALGEAGRDDVELEVVGSGPQEDAFRAMAEQILGDRCLWRGVVPRAEVAGRIAEADCLVLPSRHDGWGAVVSEALLSGVPAICSAHCGVSVIVRQSGEGGVFPVDDRDALARLLDRMVSRGPLTLERRRSLAAWARCIGANSGADHFLTIADHVLGGGPEAIAPWKSEEISGAVVVQS